MDGPICWAFANRFVYVISALRLITRFELFSPVQGRGIYAARLRDASMRRLGSKTPPGDQPTRPEVHRRSEPDDGTGVDIPLIKPPWVTRAELRNIVVGCFGHKLPLKYRHERVAR